MTKKLDVHSFETKYIGNGICFLSHKTGDIEICIEPCANGFDVAFYDSRQSLLFPKECTNLKGPSLKNAIHKALEIVNQKYPEVLKSFPNQKTT